MSRPAPPAGSERGELAGAEEPGRRRGAGLSEGRGLPEATWPDGPVPQQLHLDTTVPTAADLDVAHERALALGARLLYDRSDDPEEPLRVYADPAGHPFCILSADRPLTCWPLARHEPPVVQVSRTLFGSCSTTVPAT